MITKKSQRCTWAIAILWPSLAVQASPIVCPPTISIQESQSEPLAEGWLSQPLSSPTRTLAGVGILGTESGPELQNLIPDRDVDSKKKARLYHATWLLTPEVAPYWVRCRYNQTGLAVLRRLPAEMRRCDLEYGPGGLPLKLDCR